MNGCSRSLFRSVPNPCHLPILPSSLPSSSYSPFISISSGIGAQPSVDAVRHALRLTASPFISSASLHVLVDGCCAYYLLHTTSVSGNACCTFSAILPCHCAPAMALLNMLLSFDDSLYRWTRYIVQDLRGGDGDVISFVFFLEGMRCGFLDDDNEGV